MSLSSSATIKSKPDLSTLFTCVGLLAVVLLLVALSLSFGVTATDAAPALVGP